MLPPRQASAENHCWAIKRPLREESTIHTCNFIIIEACHTGIIPACIELSHRVVCMPALQTMILYSQLYGVASTWSWKCKLSNKRVIVCFINQTPQATNCTAVLPLVPQEVHKVTAFDIEKYKLAVHVQPSEQPGGSQTVQTASSSGTAATPPKLTAAKQLPIKTLPVPDDLYLVCQVYLTPQQIRVISVWGHVLTT